MTFPSAPPAGNLAATPSVAPVAAPADAPAPAALPKLTRADGEPIRALVVDDEPELRAPDITI